MVLFDLYSVLTCWFCWSWPRVNTVYIMYSLDRVFKNTFPVSGMEKRPVTSEIYEYKKTAVNFYSNKFPKTAQMCFYSNSIK